MVAERITILRKLMKERGIDAYLAPTSDFHESEYVGDYFKSRLFLTGFTGSAGTAVITQSEAGLWTDGRYFVQAAKELKDSGVSLMKMGQEGVPTVEEYLDSSLFGGAKLGFDGREVNARLGAELEALIRRKGGSILWEEDLVDLIWEDRPPMSSEPVWILEEKYAGKSASEKLSELQGEMEKAGASVHILTTLDDIAWLLNIRGGDVECCPVFLSYLAVTAEACNLFINERTVSSEVREYLRKTGVTLRPYEEIYSYAESLHSETVLLETGKVNYAVWKKIGADNKIIDRMNPTSPAKAVKNRTEVENMKKAHIKDGVALTKFICWLKQNVGKVPMTEMSVSERLDNLRKETPGCLGVSFPTISAYGDHAAMCHYSATPESDRELKPEGLYLVDSGGHYLEGTTDVTRTVALGPVTREEREHFTLVAMCMLRLGAAKFLHGSRGLTLDYAARQLLWSRGLNYDHGTGHGVGYLLSVHERPNGIRWKMVEERQDNCILEEGMITSDEPGIYIEGKYGIRTENLIVCEKAEKNEYGQFLKFNYLTFAPIDLDAVAPEMMDAEDRGLLNDYHREVYEKISPYLTPEEREWLREYTREI